MELAEYRQLAETERWEVRVAQLVGIMKAKGDEFVDPEAVDDQSFRLYLPDGTVLIDYETMTRDSHIAGQIRKSHASLMGGDRWYALKLGNRRAKSKLAKKPNKKFSL